MCPHPSGGSHDFSGRWVRKVIFAAVVPRPRPAVGESEHPNWSLAISSRAEPKSGPSACRRPPTSRRLSPELVPRLQHW